MPQLGNAMEEGEILAWYKKQGEPIKRGEMLLEVMTDKSAIDVESSEEGILRAVLAGVGDSVTVRRPIAIIGDATEPIDQLLAEAAAAPVATPRPALVPSPAVAATALSPRPPALPPAAPSRQIRPQPTEQRVFVSPRARRVAEDKGVTVAELAGRGTGPRGRVVARDVFAYVEERVSQLTTREGVSLAAWRGMVDAVSQLTGPAQYVAHVDDRTIPGPDCPIPVRIYRPSDTPSLPCLIYFHGGGWTAGNLDMVDATLRVIANESGWMVMSVDYRLAPEHPFPAGVEDGFAAVKWVAQHGPLIGADPARIAVGGGSAGGNISAVVCQLARDAGGPEIWFQALLYPITDLAVDTDSWKQFGEKNPMLTREHMQLFADAYVPRGTNPLDPRISPLRAENLGGLPPTLVITAEFDPLRDDGEAYAARLREAGVPVRLTRYDGSAHGFAQLGGMLGAGSDAVREVASELRDDRERRRCAQWKSERHTWCNWA
jgi:acetyl esterase